MKKYTYLLALFGLMLVFGCSKEEDLADESASETTTTDDTAEGSGSESQNQFENGILTAAEWNDLTNWTFWTELMADQTFSQFQSDWNMYPNNRYSVRITDKNANAAVGVTVQLRDDDGKVIWTAQTDNQGKAELWDNFFADGTHAQVALTISYLQYFYSITASAEPSTGTISYQMPVVAQLPTVSDIMFVVDATGSMGDEIDFLKSDLLSVMNIVKEQNNSTEIRLSTVFYRDRGDTYLTRPFDFTTDFQNMMANVELQQAAGGGDFPEAVEVALETALQQNWSQTAKAKLMFLILDAPPHQANDVIASLQNSVETMAQNGIKLIPVVASGIDKTTEFLMRFMAIGTNGTYVFLTDDSGVGESHLEPTVGQYDVEKLNELIVRLINKYNS